MSPKSMLCLAIITAALLPATVFAGAPAPGAPAGPGGAGARGGRGGAAAVPNSLSSAMGEMNRMLQDIKKVAADPAQAEQALKDLATFERDVAICKLLVPPEVNGITDAKAKAEAIASYRAMMNGLTKTALDLEDAVNDKKADDIKKLIAQLDEIEKKGHAEFKK